MSLPHWQDFTGGSRARVALWLATEIGVGSKFTKAQLRAAFPAVEQVDRRMRDLRPEGWVIHTYRDDRSLAPDELRLVTIGGPVWAKAYRSRQPSASVSDKRRAAVLAADSYVCTLCGVGAGEAYPDDNLRQARLLVSRSHQQGSDAPWRTVCERCNASKVADPDPVTMLKDAGELLPEQLDRFRILVESGVLRGSSEYGLWIRYQLLAETDREHVRRNLRWVLSN